MTTTSLSPLQIEILKEFGTRTTAELFGIKERSVRNVANRLGIKIPNSGDVSDLLIATAVQHLKAKHNLA